ncbi:presenilin 1 [Schistosoma bovis]|uniref:Presenilin n=1 Tax=Schistosoma bovis TaxID=6184 RepID=A0A430QPG6_SCHBO|nr:presenilin 1 [Schistosoma bovis]
MTTNQSSSQPIGQSNKSPREHSHGGLPTSSSAPRSRLPGHNHSSRESIDSINPDQMLYYGAKQIISEVLRAMGVFVDYITVAFALWNFGVVGMIVIHWRGPLVLQQAYLIFISAQISLMFLKYLPKWTCWLVLAALSVWDIVAVLCPNGPLRLLVEMAHERQQPLFPALLYSTTTVYLVKKHEPVERVENDQQFVGSTITCSIDAPNEASNVNCTTQSCPTTSELVVSDNDNQPVTGNSRNMSNIPINTSGTDVIVDTPDDNTSNNDAKSNNETISQAPHETDTLVAGRLNRWQDLQADLIDRDSKGVKLGLGDFVFYSLLIGRATLDGDAVTVVTCYVAILVGMCITVIVLGITRQALPALPISITCGILFYFVSSATISPFLEATATERVFF